MQTIDNTAHKINLYVMPNLYPLLQQPWTFGCVYGGRAGGKSYFAADWLILQALNRINGVCLSARQFQNSLDESSYSVVVQRIFELGLQSYFKILRYEIICLLTNTKIIFKGLDRHINSIRGINNLVAIHIDEAAQVPLYSYQILIPTTTRNPGLQILSTFNPENIDDPAYQMFAAEGQFVDPEFVYRFRGQPNTIVIEHNYLDNPYLSPDPTSPYYSPEFFTELERVKQIDPEEFEHIYMGKLRLHSNKLVYKPHEWDIANDTIESRIPQTAQIVIGLDWGFSQDPTAIQENLFWDHGTMKYMYTRKELVGIGWSEEEIMNQLRTIESVNQGAPIVADKSNPRTIQKLRTNGFNVFPSQGTPGSIIEGVRRLRGRRKFVNERCPNTIQEYRTYSHKLDPKTGRVLPEIVDLNNHSLDANRYSEEYVSIGTGQVQVSGLNTNPTFGGA